MAARGGDHAELKQSSADSGCQPSETTSVNTVSPAQADLGKCKAEGFTSASRPEFKLPG